MDLRQLLNVAYITATTSFDEAAMKSFDHWLDTGEWRQASKGSAALRGLMGGNRPLPSRPVAGTGGSF